MEYITIQEAAEKWKITQRRVQVLCSTGRIDGAKRFGHAWAIPLTATKPDDARYKIDRSYEENKTALFQIDLDISPLTGRISKEVVPKKRKILSPSISASRICHEVKTKGKESFIEWIESSDIVDECYKAKDVYAALYYISMYEYLCNELNHKATKRFKTYYSMKLTERVFQPDVYLLDRLHNNTAASEDALRKAIPEFLKHNIVETEVYDAV